MQMSVLMIHSTTMMEKIFQNLRISLRFKKFQCPLPFPQCWDRHTFLPQVPTSATFSTLKVGGVEFFSKYFFQGCLKNFLHSNNVCMYFGGKKIALVDL